MGNAYNVEYRKTASGKTGAPAGIRLYGSGRRRLSRACARGGRLFPAGGGYTAPINDEDIKKGLPTI